jgi:hypothetical protein
MVMMFDFGLVKIVCGIWTIYRSMIFLLVPLLMQLQCSPSLTRFDCSRLGMKQRPVWTGQCRMWQLRLVSAVLFLLLCQGRWLLQILLLFLLFLVLWIPQMSVLLGLMHRMCLSCIEFLGILLRLG